MPAGFPDGTPGRRPDPVAIARKKDSAGAGADHLPQRPAPDPRRRPSAGRDERSINAGGEAWISGRVIPGGRAAVAAGHTDCSTTAHPRASGDPAFSGPTYVFGKLDSRVRGNERREGSPSFVCRFGILAGTSPATESRFFSQVRRRAILRSSRRMTWVEGFRAACIVQLGEGSWEHADGRPGLNRL